MNSQRLEKSYSDFEIISRLNSHLLDGLLAVMSKTDEKLFDAVSDTGEENRYFKDVLFELLVGILDYFSQHHELEDDEFAIFLLQYFLKTYGVKAQGDAVRAFQLMQLQPPNPYVVKGGEYAAFALNAPKKYGESEFVEQTLLLYESIVVLLKDKLTEE
tara:strand:+ start:521 stop:997 length:477 start_codon:yes stop_codon:yes gene_type:complete